jgi:hypothetical protein
VATKPVAAAPPEVCRARQLDLRRGEAQRPGPPALDEEGRTVGTSATDFVLRNTSSSPCLLSGWAGLAFFGEGVETACSPSPCAGPHPDRTRPREAQVHRTSGARPVELRRGAAAAFSLTWTGTICLSEPYRLDIRVPGDATPFRVTLPRVCIAGPLNVTPLGTPAPRRST